VVAEGIDREISARVAQRLIAAIEAPLDIGGELCEVSASVGVSWGTPLAVSAAELIHRADHAMYEAKRTDCAVHFAPDLPVADTGGDTAKLSS
jgi:GGDEF domain-containing protein